MADRKVKTDPLMVDQGEAQEDPYAPTSPDYAERHQVTRYEILPGLFREDIGGPA